MSVDPLTVGPGASVDEALGLMHARGVRHLPVVEEDRMLGLVTDGQLRTAWFPSLLEEVSVRDVMTDDPLVIEADDTVYQAARLLYQHKLTGLPVLDQGRLAGIITLADVLKVFVELLGLLHDTSRLDVALKAGGSLDQVHRLIRDQGGQVVSVALLSSNPGRRVYSFRLESTDMEPLARAVAEAGHEVLS
jgi:acetoin utilization protein AcuB